MSSNILSLITHAAVAGFAMALFVLWLGDWQSPDKRLKWYLRSYDDLDEDLALSRARHECAKRSVARYELELSKSHQGKCTIPGPEIVQCINFFESEAARFSEEVDEQVTRAQYLNERIAAMRLEIEAARDARLKAIFA